MGTIEISSAEETIYKDFKEGNSVQLRVTVPPKEERQYEKGQTVNVIYKDTQLTGRIVSDPLVVEPKRDDGCETISLIVEKTGK